MKRTDHSQSGFSAVEGLLVIVVLVIVGAVGYLGYTNFVAKPKVTTVPAKTPVATNSTTYYLTHGTKITVPYKDYSSTTQPGYTTTF